MCHDKGDCGLTSENRADDSPCYVQGSQESMFDMAVLCFQPLSESQAESEETSGRHFPMFLFRARDGVETAQDCMKGPQDRRSWPFKSEMSDEEVCMRPNVEDAKGEKPGPIHVTGEESSDKAETPKE
ncbi:hypothetical protein NDU88_002365 [Pleurodeles waltl]|uniref:Uncharacterized protein n=1 Tax=Pleurodeles waltl TaxID=8319 RepID=A0AAV7KSH8_PLEWA|nr:hypothetical protein NDU88_002365 [Pleurodeles waltl]